MLAVATLAACGAGTRAVPASEPSRPEVARPATSTSSALRFDLDTAARLYEVRSTTLLYAAADSSTPLDSVTVSGSLLLKRGEPRMSDDLHMQGEVRRLVVGSGAGANRTEQSLTAPYSLQWRLLPSGVVPDDSTAQEQCDQIQQTAHDLLVSILPVLPDSISSSQNQEWGFALQLRSCRAGLHVSLTSNSVIRTSDLSGARTTGQLTLLAGTSLRVSGTGVQGASEVALRGNGDGSSVYIFDLTKHVLVSARSSSTIHLEFDFGYRTDRLIQRTVRTVAIVP